MKTENDTTERFFIRSPDGYWLTDNRCHSAVEHQRVAMDFRTAVRELPECQKWNPSCRIVDTQGREVRDTKTVGMFKPKQLRRDEFISRWTDHFAGFFHLAHDVADYDALKSSKEKIAGMAGRAWDRLPIERE